MLLCCSPGWAGGSSPQCESRAFPTWRGGKLTSCPGTLTEGSHLRGSGCRRVPASLLTPRGDCPEPRGRQAKGALRKAEGAWGCALRGTSAGKSQLLVLVPCLRPARNLLVVEGHCHIPRAPTSARSKSAPTPTRLLQGFVCSRADAWQE